MFLEVCVVNGYCTYDLTCMSILMVLEHDLKRKRGCLFVYI